MKEQYKTSAAACVSGTVGVLVGYPFDTLKTRMQIANTSNLNKCLSDLVKNEGVFALWKGMFGPVVLVSFFRIISFNTYVQTASLLFKDEKNVRILAPDRALFQDSKEFVKALPKAGLAGGISGAVITLFSAPMEIIKIQLQTSKVSLSKKQNKPNKHPSIECITSIYKQKGLRGFYNYYYLHLVRDLIGTYIYFVTYESIKYISIEKFKLSREYTPFLPIFSGGISGMVSWAFAFPIDLIKSKMQVRNNTYIGLTDCIARTYKLRGLRSFYSGMYATMIRAFPIHALNFWVYENVMKLLK